MAAVYPKQYKSFAVHKNLVEDIDASHVNNLQDEVLAIQQTLGLNPHQDTSLKMKTNTWASVAARLDAIQRGKGIPVCYMTKTSHTLKPPKTPVTGAAERVAIPFPRPSAANDPEGIFNGSSVTANRTGWWIASAYCRGSILLEDPERWLGPVRRRQPRRVPHRDAQLQRLQPHDGVLAGPGLGRQEDRDDRAQRQRRQDLHPGRDQLLRVHAPGDVSHPWVPTALPSTD
jgi:hypothetical protein